jgi:perosamine synthetase
MWKCFGDISTFSFYSNKLITTGEGGMIVTNDDELADTCASLRNLCFQPSRRFVHERLGWNLRMTNLQAAMGVAQLERIDEFKSRKRAMGARYTELLSGTKGLNLPLDRTSYAENIYWVYGVVLDDSVEFDAAEAMRRLAAMNVGCRPFFYPMHQQPVLERLALFDGRSYPVAERLSRRGFYIPSSVTLTNQQTAHVASAIRELLA